MRYRLRTLHWILGIGPPALAVSWFFVRWFIETVPFGAWPLWFMAALPVIGLLVHAKQHPIPKFSRYPTSRWIKYRRRQRTVRQGH
jgi:hypothetical protein